MIGRLQTHVRKQPIIALYFESETVLKFYNVFASSQSLHFILSLRLYSSFITSRPGLPLFSHVPVIALVAQD